MSAERALMFVHRGMDVENQWEKAVAALEGMSNLEIALVWRRFSESVPADDFKMHSEYKCLFKRAVREVERRIGYIEIKDHKITGVDNGSYSFPDNISQHGDDSVHYEYDRHSIAGSVRYKRGNSGFSLSESQQEDQREKTYDKLLHAIIKYGMNVKMGERVVSAYSGSPDQNEINEYCSALISVISENGMDPATRESLIKRLNKETISF